MSPTVRAIMAYNQRKFESFCRFMGDVVEIRDAGDVYKFVHEDGTKGMYGRISGAFYNTSGKAYAHTIAN